MLKASESRALSQEGKGRDFPVTTFGHLSVAGTIGPNEDKRTGMTAYDGESSKPAFGMIVGHL